MAFKNAVVTKELDEKYKMTDIFCNYTDSLYYKQNRMMPNRYRLVIDEELDCFIMQAYNFLDPELEHARLSKGLWVLYYKGNLIEVILDYDFDITIDGVLYDKVWSIFDIKNNELLSEKEVINLLKEILVVYNVAGAWGDIEEDYKVYVIDEIIKE